MKNLSFIVPFIFGFFLITGCNKNATKTMWVSGIRTSCDAGAGKMLCLNIYEGEDIENANWQNFYSIIDGFNFEDGQLQKIEVKEEHLSPEQTPADAPNIKYTLIKVLEKKPDTRTSLVGEWVLTKLADMPLNDSLPTPTMMINLSNHTVSGLDGCNQYNGIVTSVSSTKLTFGSLASTRKMCMNMTMSEAYEAQLLKVTSYSMENNELTLKDEGGNELMHFKVRPKDMNQKTLNGKWTLVRLNGHPIDRMTSTPTMEINYEAKTVSGNNSCNDYSGAISNLNEVDLTFGNVVATQEMCRKMETATEFNQALESSLRYKVDNKTLSIYNKERKEILGFIRN